MSSWYRWAKNQERFLSAKLDTRANKITQLEHPVTRSVAYRFAEKYPKLRHLKYKMGFFWILNQNFRVKPKTTRSWICRMSQSLSGQRKQGARLPPGSKQLVALALLFSVCQAYQTIFSKDAFSRNLCLFYYMFKILQYKHGCHATCPGRFATWRTVYIALDRLRINMSGKHPN